MCSVISRHFLIFFNILLAICSLVIIGAGGYLYYKEHNGVAIPDSPYFLSVFVMCFGSFMLLVSLIGGCGACNNNNCCLSFYSFILILMLLCQIAFGIYALVEFKDMDGMKKALGKAFKKIFNKQSPAAIEDMRQLQSTFKCCGIHGATDYTDIGVKYPDSCCLTLTAKMCLFPYQDGCLNMFYDSIKTHIIFIGCFLLAIAVLECVGAYCACAAKNDDREYYDHRHHDSSSD